ncbi:MAG: hypothetical protein N2Z62_03475 [Rhodobacteraceae bacterium]|nr:hypothetical protein [Paracoccaceae bacterium]
MLLELSLVLLVLAFLMWLSRRHFRALRRRREERARRALAAQIDWNRPARRRQKPGGRQYRG